MNVWARLQAPFQYRGYSPLSSSLLRTTHNYRMTYLNQPSSCSSLISTRLMSTRRRSWWPSDGILLGLGVLGEGSAVLRWPSSPSPFFLYSLLFTHSLIISEAHSPVECPCPLPKIVIAGSDTLIITAQAALTFAIITGYQHAQHHFPPPPSSPCLVFARSP